MPMDASRLQQPGEEAAQNARIKKRVPVGQDPRGTGMQGGPSGGSNAQFGAGTDPTQREELMRNLAGRSGSPTMDTAQAAGTTVSGAAQVTPTGQIQAGQLTGAGIGALGQAASGQTGVGGQWAHDQAQRAILAGGAKTRGRENIGLGARSETQARGLATAQLAGEQEERQLAAAAQEAQLRLQEQGMTQEAAVEQVRLDQARAMQNAQFEQDVTVLQAQLRQELNLTNAQFEEMANKVNLEVDAQLAIELDKRMNELMRMGVDEEIARQQAEEAAWQFRSELMYNYWNAEKQDRLGRDIAVLEDTATSMPWNPDAQEIIYPDTGEKYEEAGLADTGEVFDEDPASQEFNPDLYGNKGLEQEGLARELSTSEDIRTKEEADLNRIRTKVNSTLERMGQIKRVGGLALDVLGGDKKQAKERLAQEGRGELEGELSKFLGSEEGAGMGKLAGPAVGVGSALVDTAMHDDPSISKKEIGQYNVRKAVAGAGGSAVGGALGGVAGAATGIPGATAIGTKIGQTLGAMGASALDEKLLGGPSRRSIHSGQIPRGAQPPITAADFSDPARLGNRRQRFADIGENFESPQYGGRQRNLAELDELQRRLNGGR